LIPPPGFEKIRLGNRGAREGLRAQSPCRFEVGAGNTSWPADEPANSHWATQLVNASQSIPLEEVSFIRSARASFECLRSCPPGTRLIKMVCQCTMYLKLKLRGR
jgi:hypothetical protein